MRYLLKFSYDGTAYCGFQTQPGLLSIQECLENALTKKDTNRIIDFMTNNTEFKVSDEKFFDRFEWVYEGVPITFYAKKLDYGFSNVVYYGGELVDYHLNKIEIKKEIKNGRA